LFGDGDSSRGLFGVTDHAGLVVEEHPTGRHGWVRGAGEGKHDETAIYARPAKTMKGRARSAERVQARVAFPRIKKPVEVR